ncbi:MAG: HK97 family phage prohead protease [Planctomycetaceae bacterium]
MRIVEDTVEIIESRSEGQPSKLVGYGAVFYREGSPETEYVTTIPGMGVVRERILPTAFDSSLQKNQLELRHEHDEKQVIDTTDNTLRAKKDNKGIIVESDIDPTDPQYLSVVAKVKKKIARGMSFGFSESRTKDKWEQTSGGWIRWLVDIAASEFSIVRNPCYAGTSNGLRSTSDSSDIKRSFEKYRAEQNKIRFEQLNIK